MNSCEENKTLRYNSVSMVILFDTVENHKFFVVSFLKENISQSNASVNDTTSSSEPTRKEIPEINVHQSS